VAGRVEQYSEWLHLVCVQPRLSVA